MVVAVGKGGHKHEGQRGGGGGAEGFSARAPRSLDFSPANRSLSRGSTGLAGPRFRGGSALHRQSAGPLPRAERFML